MPIKIINSAVDTLECSFKNAINQESFDRLEILRNKAIETGEDQILNLGQILALSKPYGSRGFRYLATNEDFFILLSPAKTFPDAYIQMNAIGLYEKGPRDQYEYLRKNICSGGEPSEATVSRIDLCADIQGFEPTEFDRKRFVTRARNKKGIWEENATGETFTGFFFGKKNMAFRLYNKSIEIKKSGNLWIIERWNKNGYDPEIPVWRIEYQLRREKLRELNIKTVSDALDSLDSLWTYSLSWCSLKVAQ